MEWEGVTVQTLEDIQAIRSQVPYTTGRNNVFVLRGLEEDCITDEVYEFPTESRLNEDVPVVNAKFH